MAGEQFFAQLINMIRHDNCYENRSEQKKSQASSFDEKPGCEESERLLADYFMTQH
jgi:hypothetical protein